MKRQTNIFIPIIGLFLIGKCNFAFVFKSSAVEVSKVVYSNFVGTSKSEYGVDFRCSETVPCTEIFLRDVKIETVTSGSGQVAQGQCVNVRGVSTLAVPGLECLALSTDILSSPGLPEQTCMLAQSVEPRTQQMQDPLWDFESGGKRLRVYNAVIISLISLVTYILGD